MGNPGQTLKVEYDSSALSTALLPGGKEDCLSGSSPHPAAGAWLWPAHASSVLLPSCASPAKTTLTPHTLQELRLVIFALVERALD